MSAPQKVSDAVIVGAVFDDPGVSIAELSAKVGLTVPVLTARMDALEAEGKVRCWIQRTGLRGRPPRRYRAVLDPIPQERPPGGGGCA